MPPHGQAGAAAQAAAALGAAARIRDTCFGADHPLAASTMVAAERAAKNAARLASAAAAPLPSGLSVECGVPLEEGGVL